MVKTERDQKKKKKTERDYTDRTELQDLQKSSFIKVGNKVHHTAVHLTPYNESFCCES